MKKLLNAVALAGALLGASAASAGTLITEWSYDLTTKWLYGPGQTTFSAAGSNPGTTSTSDTVLSWGATGGSYTTPTGDMNKDRSALVISNGSTVGGDVFTNGPDEAGATITHFNNTISVDFQALKTTTLLTALTLQQADPVGPFGLGPLPLQFAVNFIETPNSGTCPPPSTSVCDDIFVVALPDLSFDFMWDGYVYTVTIKDLGGALHFLSPQQCAAAGVAAGCYGLQTQEYAATPINFAFNITAVPVPEPESLALFAAALFAMGAVLRRKSA